MNKQLDTTFDPAQIEARWYAHWEENGCFRPARPDAEPFTIVNPPPNVTGSLHIGHALDNTLQDIVIRYERLRGKDALWVVGTDHAGIATQMVVERQLEERQDKRTNYTREEFVQKVWEWKEESGGTITRQLRRLGCSMDWSREQFTMDEHFTKAVLKVFVDLYNDGLIYRDKRLVNWDPKLRTAISDLEVEQQTIPGGFWHFKYPLADGVTLDSGQDYIEVATTRPETMLADMAVAVHPDDQRYKSVVGKHVVLPITGRRVPVVADEHADPELGSGAVKITPGHDFNDFEVGKRAGIAPGEMLNMLDGDANVCQTADGLVPEEYIGLHRFRRDGVDGARELVVRRLKEQGFLIPHVTTNKAGEEIEHDAEPRQIATPFGDRGGVVIEPWLTDQWYVNAEELAKAPIEAVKSGAIEIVPKNWEKTFFNWMENIQPWCVSRQLWWGHRIPAWYGPPIMDKEEPAYTKSSAGDPKVTEIESSEGSRFTLTGGQASFSVYDKKVFVALTEQEALAQAREYYGPDIEVDLRGETPRTDSKAELGGHVEIWRDPDVLDTWFSSALWPFATLGWPEDDTPPPPPAVPLPGTAGEDSVSSPSPDGEGDHAQHGGGVRYKLPPKTNAAVMRAKAMRRAMPPSETALWNALRERPGGFKFRRQHPAGDYVLDFFCPAAGLAIEVDGEAHDRANRPERDAERDGILRDWGVETLRVPAREIFRDVEAVVAGIVAAAQERLPLHQPAAGPPPRRAGEDSLLAKHYPNSLLISGFDILFFWDARMMMAGYYNTGEAPWPRLYLHGLVRAADGAKMSKSKGNVVDPLGLIEQYGADALRFFMAAMESQGRDIKMDEKRVEGYRNFATKLWNATRFCQSNGIGASTTVKAPEAKLAANQWIIGEVQQTQEALDKAMAELRFDAAANTIYHFTWSRFCDWYLELIKPVFAGEADSPAAVETRAVAGWALDQILVMLHPFMPFITEELWHAQGKREYELILAQWPNPRAHVSKEATDAIDWVIELTTATRSAKNELGIPPGAKLAAYCPAPSDLAQRVVERSSAAIERLARLTPVTLGEAPSGPAMQVTTGADVFVIPLEGVIDIDAEKARLEKALAASEKEAKSLEGRLGNASFVERAKPEAVEKARADHAHHSAEVERLKAALARLG